MKKFALKYKFWIIFILLLMISSIIAVYYYYKKHFPKKGKVKADGLFKVFDLESDKSQLSISKDAEIDITGEKGEYWIISKIVDGTTVTTTPENTGILKSNVKIIKH